MVAESFEEESKVAKPKPMCPLRLLVIWLLIHVRGSEGTISVESTDSKPIYEHERRNILISANDTMLNDSSIIQVKLQMKKDWLINRAVLLNTTLNLTAQEPEKNFTVLGVFAGYAWAEVEYCEQEKCDNNEYKKLNDTVELIIVRRKRMVDKLFTILVILLVVTATLGMGCSVDIEVVKSVLKRPIAPLIGFVCQFGIMPPVAFLLGKLFQLSVAEQLGILAVGSSPGGGASNMWTVLFNGDVNLSITMTLVSTLASLGMFPLYMFTFGNLIMDKAHFAIPYHNILTSLVGLIIPILLGLLIQRKKPQWAKRIAMLTKPMMFIFLLFIFTFGIWVNWYMFWLFHLRLILASMLLPWIGYLGGGLIAIIARQPRSRVIAICIETGVQNVGVAIFALRVSLPQPQNDLSITASVCPSIFTAAPLIMSLVVFTLYQRYFTKKEVDMINNTRPVISDDENASEFQAMANELSDQSIDNAADKRIENAANNGHLA